MKEYRCTEGQSLTDVCLNTYGTMNQYVRMLNDNGLTPNDVPNASTVILWDETAVENQTTLSLVNGNKIIFATLTGFGNPEQTNPDMAKIKDTFQAQYTATENGEKEITITELQGAEVISIEKETKPLLVAEYNFNSDTGKIQLLGSYNQLEKGETLFVLYKKLTTI